MEIDTMGAYNTLKATIQHLKKTKGSILFVSATIHYRGTVMQAHVSAAKAAIDALSQVVTVEFGPFGVRSNVISPGGIEGTEGVDRLMPKEFREKSGSGVPLGRLGTVEEIADCTGISLARRGKVNRVVFIFSDAGKYITGMVFVVDGGQWHRYVDIQFCVNGSSNITDMIPYPDIVLHSATELDVGGKKKAKL